MTCIFFEILQDGIQEGNEQFTVDFEIQDDLSFEVVEGDTVTATVTIIDDDGNRHVADIKTGYIFLLW